MSDWASEIARSFSIVLAVLLALPAVLAFSKRRLELELPEALALASALALAWCMAGGLLLGLTGHLLANWIWAWLGLGICLSLGLGARAKLDARGWREALSGWRALGILLVPMLPLLAMATVPPWYRDSLVYHLALPREFARNAAMSWPDGNIFAALPMGFEMALSLLYALGAEKDFEPVFNPRLVGSWVMGAAALACVALARANGASRQFAVPRRGFHPPDPDLTYRNLSAEFSKRQLELPTRRGLNGLPSPRRRSADYHRHSFG